MSSITVAIPAQAAYVGLLRSACTHVATSANLTIEEIEDLRIAVSEAATLLIAHSKEVSCQFTPHPGSVEVLCTAKVDEQLQINKDDLAWVILSSLAEVDPQQEGNRVAITIIKERSESVSS